jgi:two-component system, cell cycle response regulator DivK
VAAKILLVEDDALSREALSRILERRGYELLIAVDGQEGVQLARERSPDLVLLDLSLPVMDGWEVTRRLRADALTRALPVIALSAHALRGDRETALAAGADEFEPKPVDPARLAAKMDALLRERPPAAAAPPPAPAALSRPATLEHLGELVAFAVDAARAVGACDEVWHAVRLAVEEVCLNVMTHGYAGGAGGPLHVAVERRDDALVVRIADEAPPFDPTRVPQPRLDAPLEEREPGGLGWHLVRAMMDEVRHEPAYPVGNVVTLVKRLGDRPAGS